MGACYDFSCPNCGYSAQVSGGDDFGFHVVTTTIVCETCRELLDVGIGPYPQCEEEAGASKTPMSAG